MSPVGPCGLETGKPNGTKFGSKGNGHPLDKINSVTTAK